ncbi:MAG: hypothetical protein L0G07_08780, partial [Chryseobacterium sp.]|nr:hypothetical protein [Chryseobacterium sp.]
TSIAELRINSSKNILNTAGIKAIHLVLFMPLRRATQSGKIQTKTYPYPITDTKLEALKI